MSETLASKNFIRAIIDQDLANGKNEGKVATRFPPEPNGYLHIGHAKAICLNFGIARDYSGTCNLRLDDTNPSAENQEYIDSIIEAVHWLGFDWQDRLYYASNYFAQFYQLAIDLIKQGKAYVCDLSGDQIREYRGTLTKPGINSPYRDRSVEENLELFERMRNGEFADGQKVLRAKIDMASPNINLRDPVIYRIKHCTHHRTGDAWCIYPMYDYAHCVSDAIEGITHSLCTLEFEDHRPLYDWFLNQLPQLSHPQQIEFARLSLSYTLTSKRKLLELIKSGLVDGWDDPRLPTLMGIRRRGVTPAAIRNFCNRIGVSKQDSVIEIEYFEECVREDLNEIAPRVMGVLHPLKVKLLNYPEEQVEWLEAPNHPKRSELGVRQVPFSGELYIEREDFMEEPVQDFYRLAPGREVRLRYGYVIRCERVIKNANGEIIQLECSYDPKTKGGNTPDGRKIKGAIHWVCARHAITAELRLYDRLFAVPNPGADRAVDFKTQINPDSLKIVHAKLEPSLARAKAENRYQLERVGYFAVDPDSSVQRGLVLNRTAALRDTWRKA